MSTYEDLAELVFPDVSTTVADLERRYPPRQLPSGALVTRFAPSPTGFLHTGSLFTALVAMTVARQSGGVYFFRLEDTDQKREIAGSGQELVEQLRYFGVIQDEGYFGDRETGDYGPYVQSKRAGIYRAVIKELMKRGRAYPCFCSAADLNLLRQTQEANKITPGYYGSYAKCRNYSIDEAMAKIKEGIPYVIRFRSLGNHLNYIKVHDLIRGDLNLSENDQDIVILKSDGLPTYHFAHLCDDHFMRTNCVTRGEEWLSSLPIHLELFSAMGWEAPAYAHLPVIMKLDNGSRRKLSKRKDSEAAVSFFLQEGYPKEGVIKYLLTIANSNFEEWLLAHPRSPVSEFSFSFEKMSLDGALFDLPKLQSISKDVIAYADLDHVVGEAGAYAAEFDSDLANFMQASPERFRMIMNIERNQDHPRKDYEKYADIYPKIKFFDPTVYDRMLAEAPLPFNEFIDRKVIKDVLQDFANTLDLTVDEQIWFSNLKALGVRHGFAESFKVYKNARDSYRGHVGDIAEMVRIAMTTSRNSPNLYQVLSILGPEEVRRRITETLKNLG